jgi:predicted O-methyltransferase YrrM
MGIMTSPESNLKTTLRVAHRRARYLGGKAGLATVLTESAPRLTQRIQQLIGHPSLFELQQRGSLSTSPRDVLKSGVGLDDRDWDRVEAEFVSVENQLNSRRERKTGVYPGFFEIEKQTGLLLYGLTRLLKPKCVVETGVADGVSTYIVLAALAQNGAGELHSIDIARDVGCLVDDCQRWNLHVADSGSVEDVLADLVGALPPIDLFFHDADHRFLPQLCEYETFAASAPPRAVLVSDDVDLSYAFDTFCKRRELAPSYLLDSRKVAGVVRL